MNCHCCKSTNAKMQKIGKEAEIPVCDECYKMFLEMEQKHLTKLNKTA